MKMFEHTASEPGMWRGWTKGGQVLELHRGRRGWSFGAGIHLHGNDDDDKSNRMLFIKFWRFTAVIPMGIVDNAYPFCDEPQWSAYFHSECDVVLRCGQRSFYPRLPWQLEWHRTSKMMADGSWFHETRAGNLAMKGAGIDAWRFNEREVEGKEWRTEYPYTYTLESGDVQRRTASVKINEMEWRRRALMWTGIGAKVVRSIEVNFSDEVGERSGSWKGGCIGCGYEMHPGEDPESTLRRMERERKF